MKNITLIITALFILVSCSGNKKMVSQDPGLENAPHGVISYGPKGQIISTSSTEEIASQPNQRDIVVEEEMVLNQEAQVTAAQSSGNSHSQKVVQNKKAKRTSKYVHLVKKKSQPKWEPYGNKSGSADSSKNGFAIAGFVMSFFSFLSPLALVFSIIGLKSEKRGLAIAGIVLSSLWILLLLAALIIGLALL